MLLQPNFSLKKTALLAIGFSVPTCVFAANPLFNGYYGGVSGGVMRAEAKISNSANSAFENFTDDGNQLALAQSDTSVHQYSGAGAIYVGYGQFMNNSNFYMAGEIFGDWASRKTTLNNWAFHAAAFDEDFESLTTSTRVRLQNGEFGLDIRPGYLMDTNTLVYARLGLAFNKVKTATDTTFSFTNLRPATPTTRSTTLSQSNRHSKPGVRLGVGLEHMITDSLAITADYIYTHYGKAKTTGVSDTTTISSINESGEDDLSFVNVDGLTAQSSGRIRTQSAMLGIKYFIRSFG